MNIVRSSGKQKKRREAESEEGTPLLKQHWISCFESITVAHKNSGLSSESMSSPAGDLLHNLKISQLTLVSFIEVG